MLGVGALMKKSRTNDDSETLLKPRKQGLFGGLRGDRSENYKGNETLGMTGDSYSSPTKSTFNGENLKPVTPVTQPPSPEFEVYTQEYTHSKDPPGRRNDMIPSDEPPEPRSNLVQDLFLMVVDRACAEKEDYQAHKSESEVDSVSWTSENNESTAPNKNEEVTKYPQLDAAVLAETRLAMNQLATTPPPPPKQIEAESYETTPHETFEMVLEEKPPSPDRQKPKFWPFRRKNKKRTVTSVHCEQTPTGAVEQDAHESSDLPSHAVSEEFSAESEDISVDNEVSIREGSSTEESVEREAMEDGELSHQPGRAVVESEVSSFQENLSISAVRNTRKASKEARYKNILAHLMPNKLAPVKEELEPEKSSAAKVEAESKSKGLTVRVPGLLMCSDVFIDSKDLIGSEVTTPERSAACVKTQKTNDASLLQIEAMLDGVTNVSESQSRRAADMTSGSDKPSTSVRNIAWMDQLQNCNPSSETTSIVTEDAYESPRQLSAPKKLEFSPSKAKPLWKAAVDPASGRTYYYHRVTRETTWVMPPREDIETVKVVNDDVRLSSVRDFDPEAWRSKQQMESTLTTTTSPTDLLVAKHVGREEQLLASLQDMAESKPFDEPVKEQTDKPMASIRTYQAKTPSPVTKEPPGAKLAASTDVEEVSAAKRLSNYSMGSRAMTYTRTYSMSNRVGTTTSTFSHLTEATQVINNTAGAQKIRADKSLLELDSATGPRRAVELDVQPLPVKTQRTRDLVVEEFRTEGPIAEMSDGNEDKPVKNLIKPLNSSRRQLQNSSPLPSQDLSDLLLSDTQLNRSDEETFSLPDDCISAMSEVDLELDQKEGITVDVAQRRALDDAITSEDWDLAAAISENLRTLKPSAATRGRETDEWTHEELDRFISENDWDAVATYIAHVRREQPLTHVRNQQPPAPKASARSVNDVLPSDSSVAPTKQYGAESQLQNKEQGCSSYVSEEDLAVSSGVDQP